MKKIFIYILMTLSGLGYAAPDVHPEELVHPSVTSGSRLVDLRRFEDFYNKVCEVNAASSANPQDFESSTSLISDEAMDFRRHPIVSLQKYMDLKGYDFRQQNLIRRVLSLNLKEVKSDVRDGFEKFQDTYEVLNIAASKNGFNILHRMFVGARKIVGSLHIESHEGYQKIAPPSPIKLPGVDLTKDVEGLSPEETSRLVWLSTQRLDLSEAKFGEDNLEPFLRPEIDKKWQKIRSAHHSSIAVRERLEKEEGEMKEAGDSLAAFFGKQKNYAHFSVMVMGRKSSGDLITQTYDLPFILSSGTMPLGVEGTEVVHDPELDIAYLRHPDFDQGIVFPGSSFYPKEAMEADAEIRARLSGGLNLDDSDGQGPKEKRYHDAIMNYLRTVGGHANEYSPHAMRAYCAREAANYAEGLSEGDIFKLFAHSEQAVHPFVKNWLPYKIQEFITTHRDADIHGIFPMVSTLRDACAVCSKGLGYACESQVVTEMKPFGVTNLPDFKWMVIGHTAHLIQTLDRNPDGSPKRYNKKYSRTRRLRLIFTGEDLSMPGAKVYTINGKED